MAQSLHSQECASDQRPMTLKIERTSGKRRTRIRLSGEFRSELLDLVNVEGVRFLNACEADGISVLRCSPYIREWMSRERGRPKARTRKRKKERASLEDEDGKHV